MSSPTRAVFAIRDFRLFILARLFTSLAMPMMMVSIGWTVYDLTRDPFDLGYVGLTMFLPQILLTLPAGHCADRYDRRHIVLAAISVQSACSLLLTALAWRGLTSPLPIYAVMLPFACANAMLRPAMLSLLPQLVPKDRLAPAVAINSSTWQTAGTSGPALGGLLYGFSAPAVFAVVALLFLIAILLFRRLSPRPPLGKSEGGMIERLLAGVTFVRQRPVLLGAMSLDLFAVLFGGATALLPVYARDILTVGPWGLGLLRSAPAVGAVACGVWLAHHPIKRHAGGVMFTAVAVFGATTILFGLSTFLPLSLLALLVMGASDMVSIYIRQTLMQLNTPDAMRGRVSAVSMVFIGASNELGEFESGITAGWFGTVSAVVLGGVGTILVVLIWRRLFPGLRRVDSLERAIN